MPTRRTIHPFSTHLLLGGFNYREVEFMQEEIWKDIEGFEGRYQVSNMGRVKALVLKHKSFGMDRYITRKEHIRKTYLRLGYCRVILWANGKPKAMDIHRLVANAFIPNPENKEMINHIDCNTLNNRVDNLEWCTNSENQIHAMKNGLKVDFGANHPNSKLTEDDVRFIRSHYKFRDTVYNTRSLAEMFGVSHGIISRVISGKSYKNVV